MVLFQRNLLALFRPYYPSNPLTVIVPGLLYRGMRTNLT